MKSYPLLMLPLLFSGCTLIYRYDVPEFRGQLLTNGVPVQGANVMVSGFSTKERVSALTQPDGSFSTPRLGHFGAPTLLGDPLSAYKLAFEIDGVRYLGLSSPLLPGYPPAHVEVTCDVSKPVKHLEGIMICTSKDLPF